jgi:hypothetical protein
MWKDAYRLSELSILLLRSPRKRHAHRRYPSTPLDHPGESASDSRAAAGVHSHSSEHYWRWQKGQFITPIAPNWAIAELEVEH